MIIKLSDHFDYKRILRFTLPSVLTMLFSSVYCIVDGFFISNFVGASAFASVNLVMPFLQILSGVGAMLGVGGSALVSITFGTGDKERACRYFTMMIYLEFMAAAVLTIVGIIFMKPISYLLGATDSMIKNCVTYGIIIMLFSLFMHLQYTFQSFLVVAERPKLGLYITLAAGITNMVLDALFVGLFKWGVAGAAVATGMSQMVGGLIPLLWFAGKKNTSHLKYVKTKMEWKPILRACANGASEMLSSISGSIIGMLYNLQLMKYAGEMGVAAYGTIMYAGYVAVALFMGYSEGIAPVIGYHYGAQHNDEMHNLLSRSLRILAISGLVLAAAGYIFAKPISSIFVGYDRELLAMTVRACKITMPSIIVFGMCLFFGSFFTALGNAKVSLELSLIHTLVFPLITILALPYFWGLDGIWYAMTVSEIMSFAVGLAVLAANKKNYHY